MKIISKSGNIDLAMVYVASFRGSDAFLAEFVDARDPELPLEDKWVIIVSTQFGCPVNCLMCDAGGNFLGNMTSDEMFAQIDCVIGQHPSSRMSKTRKFKIQFARMGEPALNPAVLDALRELPRRYGASGLIPCVATIAPASAGKWFEDLIEIRNTVYSGMPFQLQLSINSTDAAMRDRLMPTPKLSFEELSEIARKFSGGGPRKVALNFALMDGTVVDPEIVRRYFDPTSCCIKITPLNPTTRSGEAGLSSAILATDSDINKFTPSPSPLPWPPQGRPRGERVRERVTSANRICDGFRKEGYDVILSIGDSRENAIGSNCGMAVKRTSRGIADSLAELHL